MTKPNGQPREAPKETYAITRKAVAAGLMACQVNATRTIAIETAKEATAPIKSRVENWMRRVISMALWLTG